MNQIEKYIERLKQLQSLYEVGQPQYNAFGIAINEANEMLVKNCINPDVNNRYSEKDMHEAFRGFATGKKFEDWLKSYNSC